MIKLEDVTNYVSGRQSLELLGEEIERRIQEVVHCICLCCEAQFDWYEFREDSNDVLVSLPDLKELAEIVYLDFSGLEEKGFAYYGDCPAVEVGISVKGSISKLIIEAGKKQWDFSTGFPLSFLFVENFKIEEFFKKIRQLAAEAKLQKAGKQKESRNKQKILNARMAEERKRIKKELGMK